MKLITTREYLLYVDENARISQDANIMNESTQEITITNDEWEGDLHPEWKKIISYYPLTKEAKELDLPLLPDPFKNDLQEAVTEIEVCLLEAPIDCSDSPYANKEEIEWKRRWKKASLILRAAQSKQFSLDDIEKAYRTAYLEGRGYKNRSFSDFDNIMFKKRKEYIESLSTQSLPEEFIPEYEYYYMSSEMYYGDKADWTLCNLSQYNTLKNSLPICPLKKEFKTITNSEGKQVIQGTYKY